MLVRTPAPRRQARGELEQSAPAIPGDAALSGMRGFDEAEMPRRNFGLASEVELAETPPLPPLPQQLAHGSDRAHRRRLARIAESVSLRIPDTCPLPSALNDRPCRPEVHPKAQCQKDVVWHNSTASDSALASYLCKG